MKRILTALMVFLLFMTLSVVTSFMTYFVVFGVIFFVAFTFHLSDNYSWLPLTGTCLVFVIGLVTAIRNRIPDITRLKWDSGTIQDCPSPVYIPRGGGRLWNMNPLGPQSVASIAAIGGAILCAGPSLAISAFISALEELRKDSQPSPAGDSQPAQRGPRSPEE